jgi:hypothetical protein
MKTFPLSASLLLPLPPPSHHHHHFPIYFIFYVCPFSHLMIPHCPLPISFFISFFYLTYIPLLPSLFPWDKVHPVHFTNQIATLLSPFFPVPSYIPVSPFRHDATKSPCKLSISFHDVLSDPSSPRIRSI